LASPGVQAAFSAGVHSFFVSFATEVLAVVTGAFVTVVVVDAFDAFALWPSQAFALNARLMNEPRTNTKKIFFIISLAKKIKLVLKANA
jgi:hypothetical protein